jgi:predicted dehydrogenase
MSHEPLQVAQIGCGYWGPNLVRSFSALEGCRVKYVAEASPERRRFVESNFPRSRAVADMMVVLEDPAVQAVVVATPARSHFAIAKQALSRGKHTLVEKPLAMCVAEVDELTALAAKQRLTLMVGHTFLFNPAVSYLKNLIAGGGLGRVYYVYARRVNLGVIRSDVNAMWNLAPHDVSILCHLLGTGPVRVAAHGTDYIQPGVEDVVFMHLEFPDKICAHVHVSWLDPNKVRRVTVVGSRKMAVYDDVADDKIAIYDKGIESEGAVPERPFDSVSAARFVHRAGDILLPRIAFKEPLRLEAEHFLECIRAGKTPLTGPAHARQVVEVLEKAQRVLRPDGAAS